MARGTSSYAVMGLLSMSPDTGMSGYDLWQAFDRSIAGIWSLSKAQVYKELPRLEAEGLVTSREVVQSKAPDKRVYLLTETGRAELEAWLGDGELIPVPRRHPWILKVFFGHVVGSEAIDQLLAKVEATIEADLDVAAELRAFLADIPEGYYVDAVLRRDQAVGQADLDAVRQIRSELPDVDDEAIRSSSRDAVATFDAAPDWRSDPQ